MKQQVMRPSDRVSESPPARGRGLKLVYEVEDNAPLVSPPARGRGLKPAGIYRLTRLRIVAPCAGAWIETVGAMRLDCV